MAIKKTCISQVFFVLLPMYHQRFAVAERYLARTAELCRAEYRCRLQPLWCNQLYGARGALVVGQYCDILVAAAQNSLVAKGKIVDYLFNEHFSEARQIEDADKENIAKVICYLAQELIDKSHRVYHYREILGVTLFCMKKYSAAKDVLLKLRGQEFVLGRFCLGYMYEYGLGTEKDFDESLRFYEKAKEFPKTKERTKAVKK